MVQLLRSEGQFTGRSQMGFPMDRDRHRRGCTQGCAAGATSIANEILLSASMRFRVETVRHHPLSEIRKPV